MKRIRRWSRKFETNLLRLASTATEEQIRAGMDWYPSANRAARSLANRYSLPLETVVGVIAVLSPGCEWSRNLGDAETAISSYILDGAVPTVGVYGRRNQDKAQAILSGKQFESVVSPVTSPKVTAFYHAILSPFTATTPVIDQHLIAAMHGKLGERGGSAWTSLYVRDRLYPWYAWHLSRIAERSFFSPVLFQAILWLAWKENKGVL